MFKLIVFLYVMIFEICNIEAGLNLFKKNTCNYFVDYMVAPVSPNCYNDPNVGDHMVDLTNMQSEPDGEYKLILNYQDHLTEPRNTKTAEEVAVYILDVFCLFGAPNILHSDNRREFCNPCLYQLKIWYSSHIQKMPVEDPTLYGWILEENTWKANFSSQEPVPDDVGIIKRAGYPLTVHLAETIDGFIIELYRLPQENGQPVLLQHGISSSGNIWVDKNNRSLAFQLHDRGFDVWIGASRASTYAKGNTRYSMSDDEYWDWSIDQVALIDLPTMIEYIATVTGKAKEILYVGHSMGTTALFMYNADMPDHAEKYLKGSLLLSPIAFFHAPIPFNFMVPFPGLIRAAFRLLGIRGIFRHEKIGQNLINLSCRMKPVACYTMMQTLCGKDDKQFLADDQLLFVSAFFTSISVDQFVHYLQMARAKEIQKFDYGAEKNIEIYGQELPPKYNLNNIKLPMAFFYGLNDNLTPLENLERTVAEISSKLLIQQQVSPAGGPPYNHINFIYGKDVISYLYEPMFDILEKQFRST